MSFTAIPLDVISAPNYYKPLPDDRWEIVDPNAQDLYFSVNIDDSLGLRRYIPAAGSSISVVFQRADEFQTDLSQPNRLQSQPQTITKTATVDSNDRSLWKISLTSQDVSGIVSGTVKFELTESGITTVFLENYFVRKNLTDAGF